MEQLDLEDFESVFSSMKGHEKAKPTNHLFDKIDKEVNSPSNVEMYEHVFSSMKGYEKKQPSKSLYEKIKSEISSKEASIIIFRRPFISAAAAAAILILNVVTILQYSETQSNQTAENVTDIYDNSFITSYEIYE